MHGGRTVRATIGLLAAVLTIAGTMGAVPALASTHHHHHRQADSDHDGMPNRWGRAHGLAVHHRNANKDPDHDGLVNLGEYKQRTRPHVADTDGDGLADGAEVHRFGTNPKNDDSDHDGIEDGNEDGNHDGVCDEGEDGDGQGFVGSVISYDAGTGQLLFESTMGYPVVGVVERRDRPRVRRGLQRRGLGDEPRARPGPLRGPVLPGRCARRVPSVQDGRHGLPAAGGLERRAGGSGGVRSAGHRRGRGRQRPRPRSFGRCVRTSWPRRPSRSRRRRRGASGPAPGPPTSSRGRPPSWRSRTGRGGPGASRGARA